MSLDLPLDLPFPCFRAVLARSLALRGSPQVPVPERIHPLLGLRGASPLERSAGQPATPLETLAHNQGSATMQGFEVPYKPVGRYPVLLILLTLGHEGAAQIP